MTSELKNKVYERVADKLIERFLSHPKYGEIYRSSPLLDAERATLKTFLHFYFRQKPDDLKSLHAEAQQEIANEGHE
jgi:hypothetical protein